MNNKKRLVSAAFLLVFLLVLAGAGNTEWKDKAQRSMAAISGQAKMDQSATESPGDSPMDNTETGQADDEKEKNYDEVVEAIDSILANGTSEFYENYPVDESFFLWLESHYGAGTVDSIATSLREKNADPDLWYQMTGCTMHVLWLEFCKEYQYQTYRLENVTWKDTAAEDRILIDFVGDINFDPTWHTMKYAKRKGGVDACISQEILKELQSADITMVNNEFCFTEETARQEGKAYSFKAEPENADLLDFFGTDIVSLANNHTCDYGEQGLLDTMDTLKEKGIVYSGAGRDLAEASAVQYFVTGGRKIAFVSATEIERFYHFTKKAGENTPGVLKTQQKKAVLAAIKQARANSDYVIMFVHWGAEGKIKQDADQRALAQEYVSAGVDAIIGSHPHRLQGVEFIEGVPIVYSLGNFWFSTGTLYATVAQIQIDSDGNLQLRLLPCEQKGKRTLLLENEEDCKNFYQYVADMSSGVQIDENGTFAEWDESKETETPPLYRSGRQYGQHFDNADLELRAIDVVGNLQ